MAWRGLGVRHGRVTVAKLLGLGQESVKALRAGEAGGWAGAEGKSLELVDETGAGVGGSWAGGRPWCSPGPGGTHAWIDSVTEPIWLTFSSRQLQAFFSTAWAILLGLVTVRSSPTIWMLTPERKEVQVFQSSWSKGSSMETTGGKGQSQVKSQMGVPAVAQWDR